MPLSRSPILKPINALVNFLRLRDLLSRCSVLFNSNRRKIFKIVARYVGCSVFAFICYLCQPYGFMVLAWGLICLLIFFLRRLWWVCCFNCSVVLFFWSCSSFSFWFIGLLALFPTPAFSCLSIQLAAHSSGDPQFCSPPHSIHLAGEMCCKLWWLNDQ